MRTARRWEQAEGLPVRRYRSGGRSSVYAYPSELDAWRVARKPKAPEAEPARPSWRRLIPALAVGLALLSVAAFIQWGPILNPPDSLAEAANVDGGSSARQVWTTSRRSHFHGSISPDGRYFYVSGQGPKNNLLVRDLVAGENRTLTDNSPGEYSLFPAISRDGQKVAYVQWTEDETPQLRVVRLDSSDHRVLVDDEEVRWLAPFDWSPDGSRILAVFQGKDDNNQIVMVSAQDGTAQVLKSLEWRYPLRMSFSPDGRFIAYDVPTRRGSPNRDISILSTDGGRETVVVGHPSHDRFPVWTPDGGNILFTSDRTGTTGYWMIPVAEGKTEGSSQLVKADTGLVRAIGFAADGAYYHSKATTLQDVYITTLDPVSGEVQREPTLTSEGFRGANTLPEWSPDGKYLAYFSRRDPFWHLGAGSGVIVIRSFEDGEERELPLNVSFLSDTRLRWSPDGRFLLFGGCDEKRQGLYQVDVRTGELTAVVVSTVKPEQWHSAWGHEGKTIFYIRDEDGEGCEIRARELETGTEKVLYNPDPPSHLSNLVASPDGERLAFGAGEVRGHIAARTFMVMSATGGEPRTVLDLDPKSEGRYAFSLEWTQAGDLYYPVRTGGRDVYVAEMDFSTGTLLKPPSKPIERHIGWNEQPVWSPDGEQLAYVSLRSPQGVVTETIVIRSVDTGEERELHPDFRYFSRRVRWSPDGRSFLTQATSNKGQYGIHRIDAETGALELILEHGHDPSSRDPQWSNDGKTIYYGWHELETKQGAIRVRDAGSG